MIHEESIIPKFKEISMHRMNIHKRHYNNLRLLRVVEEEIVLVFVCHCFRDLTLASMSSLMVG